MNLIVIDNFLPYPNVVRSWALQQRYYSCDEMTDLYNKKTEWPGVRTVTINELDVDYANIVLGRTAQLAQHHFGLPQNISIRSSFQLTRETDGNSWIHQDHDVDVAFIIYLTPEAPHSAGTTLYSQPPHEIVDRIGNVYNRLIMYRANLYHKSNDYFGDSLTTGRLTQVGFIKVE